MFVNRDNYNENDLFVNKDYFLCYWSKTTFSCDLLSFNQLYIRAVAVCYCSHHMIAALALLEDFTKAQLRRERVFRSHTDVLAQDDEAHHHQNYTINHIYNKLWGWSDARVQFQDDGYA